MDYTNEIGINTDPIKTKDNVVVINNDKKKAKKLKLKKAPKSKINLKPTEEQKWRDYQTYIVPQIAKYDVENPDNDIVKAIKKAFGEDNKETLNNNVLPTFTYENDIVKNKIRNELFDTEQKLAPEKSLKTLQGIFKRNKALKEKEDLFNQLGINPSFENLNKLGKSASNMKQIEKQLKSENAVKTIQNKFRQNRQEKKAEKKAEILQNQKLEKGISAVKAIQNKFRETKNRASEINLNEDINNLMKNYTKVKAQKIHKRMLHKIFKMLLGHIKQEEN